MRAAVRLVMVAATAVVTMMAVLLIGGAGTAAADEWPTTPDYPTPLVPFDTKRIS